MSGKLKISVEQYKGSFAFDTAVSECYIDGACEENLTENTAAIQYCTAGQDISLPPLKLKSTENSEKGEALKKLRDYKINNCIKCGLSKERNLIVFGEGNADSDLMFIGEAPGADEDKTGRPFIGKAGQLLTKIIESINLKRESVYIANIIKCRPPGNRNPEQNEIESCSPFLREQIDIIKPKIICTLGKFSTMFIFNEISNAAGAANIEFEKIGSHRGKIYNYKNIKVIPTYHPSYLLRNPSAKKDVWEDMKLIRGLLSEYI
ncbi:MAG: uracil-DNA glycosylase [Candidatus Acididesulfobacter guangdongensis]|uniref:Type-4 uracil-DNA glycosylase n=1 Tax=Acididesulfobacter guangdongensis TaxID=2597225 RepID=A0A519BIG5_ACIG2|nr:MAG: uracil-DNA glycosylase [Candidatus Acididesulfobacter guangdongensis]